MICRSSMKNKFGNLSVMSCHYNILYQWLVHRLNIDCLDSKTHIIQMFKIEKQYRFVQPHSSVSHFTSWNPLSHSAICNKIYFNVILIYFIICYKKITPMHKKRQFNNSDWMEFLFFDYSIKFYMWSQITNLFYWNNRLRSKS